MTEEHNINKNKETPVANDPRPKKYVSNSGIVILALYLIGLGIFIIYGLIAFWPPASSIDTNDLNYTNVEFLSSSFEISNEVRLILLVALSGALGSLIHAFRSFFWYVGNREFVRSWILMYIFLPFIGSSLGLIFYFVLRGGLFSTQASVESANPFGFTGLAGLVGMFSNQAALKLQEIAETMFSTQESTAGKDHVSSKEQASLEDSQSEPETEENNE
jgi:hypothetical protein